ncbi:ABC-type dipeptide/oligopeptide transport system, ATPase component [Thermococcus kodakarensis KOD1]|uniref:ABC-type dipeptide/oligopeptide transport system, ATPase component n=1 Tax=Thermococcus kodakarensis (strain ATCC BAA-918 / JCM 12380 / KOD1) TaxID=69014 RepID=Q5JDU2_THEKO|nr:ABC transporter ATP-binding protein [Thermococcus kodakarensis]WCN27670.1 ABC transporter ATP-binding protein [Thermococcus kodakarensis]WCN29961.1 ABC transporter ATP-binding protein [Thermococcus kodakarensis]BAD85945.1 ABC-type dipeptide/oligopeptide transport system, ATPase component [Thermococcus kodakarensis KOD1]
MSEPLVRVEHLTRVFTSGFISGFQIKAVDDVSFNIREGEIISLVGESGSGKTTIGRIILRLLPPTSGRILFKGEDIMKFNKKQLKSYYKQVQAVFQDPFASFNPVYPVDRAFDMIFDSFFPDLSHGEREELIAKALEDVGLNPDEVLGKYPHQFSGGQLQRILIARALLVEPSLLVADEAVSMLDASTRIDVLNLLGDVRDRLGTSVLFVTHDLALGYYISDTTLIMYRGRLVEFGDTERVFKNPLHPYTRMLLESVPDLNVKWEFKGEIRPEAEERSVYEIGGCNYAPRCPFATEKCWKVRPQVVEVEKNHWVACHLHGGE